MRFHRTPEEQFAVDTYRAASEALDVFNQRVGTYDETHPEWAEYLRLSHAVAAAEPALLAIPLHLRRVVL